MPERKDTYTSRHEIIMKSCEQITIEPGTKHWFQAGSTGAVLYSFSTCSCDALDKFTDSSVERITKMVD